jgi:hypothetical protein
MKPYLKPTALFVFGVLMQLPLLAQTPTGQASNLCPRTTVRYTSASSDVNGGSCGTLGWICSGCVDNDGTATSSVIASGVNGNGTFWADVKWGNVASGSIATICGSLNVQIDAISQASIVGPSTVLLCGTSSLTLQASVASQTNVVGFKWQVSGTGVSPTGMIETTDPQITLNFSNWTPSSNLSATVAVAARSACGFNTDLGPLTPVSIPGLPTIPAIPRSAWVQLSPGNIDNLMNPLNFNPSVICSSATMTITDLPAGTNVAWSSGNSQALTINSSTGFASKFKTAAGQVSVSATLSNACGSFVQSRNIWLGTPHKPLVSGPTLVTASSTNNYSAMPWGSQPPFLEQGVSSSGYEWTFPLTATNAGWQCFGCIFETSAVQAGSLSTWVSLRTQNTCGYSPITNYEVFVQQENCPPGGCEEPFIVYPNPSSEELMISSNSADAANDVSSVTLVDANGSLVYKNEPNKTMRQIKIPVREFKNGTYYLTVIQKGKAIKKQLVISHQ